MNKNITSSLDTHLRSFDKMQEASTDEFFYTRLKARIENKEEQKNWSFPLKPVWVISVLIIMLSINSFVLIKQNKNDSNSMSPSQTIQGFAEAYDQQVINY